MGETIGWIGVGSIGHRMAKHLTNAGHKLVVADAMSTDRAPEGSKVAKSNAEVAAGAETVILSLPNGKISVEVAREIANAPGRKAKTVIDTSTIGIAAAEEAAAILSAAGVTFVDAPVSGGIAGADKATLSVMMACAKADPQRHARCSGILDTTSATSLDAFSAFFIRCAMISFTVTAS